MKHLPSHGWHPIVVRVDPAHYTEPLDWALARLVPESAMEFSTGALPAALTRRLGVGDIGIRGYFHIQRTLKQVAAERSPRAVLITGSPYYPMLLSSWINRSLGLPVVLDFQDPWVSAAGAAQPTTTKAGLAHLLAVALEPTALRGASFVTSVSEIQNREMAARYNWLDSTRMADIPIGGDPEDFQALRSTASSRRDGSQVVEIAYVGSIWPRVLGTLGVLLDAITKFAHTCPAVLEKVVFRFYGTDPSMSDAPQYQVMPLAASRGLTGVVEEFPRRLPFLDALMTVANAHGVLMLGSDEPHYTASKIYPALMSGRPFVSIFHSSSSAQSVLARAGGGVAIGFESSTDLGAQTDRIADALARLAFDHVALGRADPRAYERYTANAVARRFAHVFDTVCSNQTVRTCG